MTTEIENGTAVVMKRSHPHAGKRGFVYMQPEEAGGSAGGMGMYLIEFEQPYEANCFAFPNEFTVVEEG